MYSTHPLHKEWSLISSKKQKLFLYHVYCNVVIVDKLVTLDPCQYCLFLKVFERIIMCGRLFFFVEEYVLLYRETSMFRHHLFPRNMTELRIWQSFGAALPAPSKLCWNRGNYISNSYCNVIILVRVLVASSSLPYFAALPERSWDIHFFLLRKISSTVVWPTVTSHSLAIWTAISEHVALGWASL